jgi:hypothetical protein
MRIFSSVYSKHLDKVPTQPPERFILRCTDDADFYLYQINKQVLVNSIGKGIRISLQPLVDTLQISILRGSAMGAAP